MAKTSRRKITDFIPDSKNINAGSEFGSHLLEKSIQEVGLGRSIVVDKNDIAIAGNKTLEKAVSMGFKNAIVVESNGTELVVVKRTDLDINSEMGVKAKILDNTVQKHNYVEDAVVMQAVVEEYKIHPEDYGLNGNYFINGREDLIGKEKGEPPTLKITFASMADLLRFEKKFQELAPEFPGTYFSINNGR